MRSKLAVLLLSGALALGLAGCSKKDNSQATQPAPATPDQSAQTAAPASNPPAANAPAPNTTMAPAGNTAMAPAAQSPAPAAAPEPVAQAPVTPPPPPPPPPLVVPAGTSIVVRMGTGLTTKTAAVGQSFNGVLAHSIAVNGVVAVPAGAGVSGSVTDSKSPGKFKGEGVLSITVNAINVGGTPVTVETSAYTQVVKGKGKRTAVVAGGGTGLGALIGGLAGGGKGAAIGALAGAGAGTAGAAFTGNKDVEIPAESVVTFKLASSITVRRHARPAAAAAPVE